jgi:DNA-3-methyladenine glycosylase II
MKHSSELETNLILGIEELKKRNSIFDLLVQQLGTVEFKKDNLVFESLIKIIVNQQLSSSAAKAIFSRISDLFPNSQEISPEDINGVDSLALRGAGISNSKVGFIKSLADEFIENPGLIKQWEELDQEQALVEIQKLKGFGIWSANIILLFYLGKQNIFPIGDSTLNKAYTKLFDNELDKELNVINWCEPYRSILALYLWNWVDVGMKEFDPITIKSN